MRKEDDSKTWEIIPGDCLEVMKTFPDNHFSAIVTDPPYGLSFMGKGWDHVVPEVSYWKEALRISKPGSFLLAMGGTRTFHRLTCEIEDAGWEIRDCLAWLYGSGFPKSNNNFGIPGYGTALKPAWEPIIMAMKPIDGTFAQNAEKWGQAGINIDGCRIGNSKPECKNIPFESWRKLEGRSDIQVPQQTYDSSKGRWPANLILDEEAGAMLDEQTGVLKSGSRDKHNKTQLSGFHGNFGLMSGVEYKGDSGGASRFFYCAKTSSSERNDGLDSLSLKEGSGCYGEFAGDGRGRQTEHLPQKNNHPTVKPLALMEYLIKLIMPPKDGLLLDPFAGSGSTVVAAKRLSYSAIGIEKQEEYVTIARKRLENV